MTTPPIVPLDENSPRGRELRREMTAALDDVADNIAARAQQDKTRRDRAA
jgi:hypothetical protein